ncbi:hypothetical protein DFJ74DRAFT_670396 [Hyaloraphidium curvatum]|nr:hypothetical protein DFJ74DRAFT_670396 [Hyaloraphidium curvatum]
MVSTQLSQPEWQPFFDFWFPTALETSSSAEDHGAHFRRWFAGGTTQGLQQFADLLVGARHGQLDSWTADPEGHLALVVLLDQAPRGLFAGSPEAYACDSKACSLANMMLANGSYDKLHRPWHKTFVGVALAHCEGPDHLERLNVAVELADAIAAEGSEALRGIYEHSARQAHGHREVIARFGRFPHRNAVLGRESTDEEEEYLEKGDFVFNRPLP